jgi:hypothetical protein
VRAAKWVIYCTPQHQTQNSKVSKLELKGTMHGQSSCLQHCNPSASTDELAQNYILRDLKVSCNYKATHWGFNLLLSNNIKRIGYLLDLGILPSPIVRGIRELNSGISDNL